MTSPTGCGRAASIPATIPKPCADFSNWVKFASCRKSNNRSANSSANIPGKFLRFTLERVLYFWIGPPQANIVAGYDLMIARHLMFILPAAFAFAGLWLTLRNRKQGGFLLACFLLIYPLPYYLVNPFPRYKHAIEPEMILLAVYLVLGSKPGADPLAGPQQSRSRANSLCVLCGVSFAALCG